MFASAKALSNCLTRSLSCFNSLTSFGLSTRITFPLVPLPYLSTHLRTVSDPLIPYLRWICVKGKSFSSTWRTASILNASLYRIALLIPNRFCLIALSTYSRTAPLPPHPNPLPRWGRGGLKRGRIPSPPWGRGSGCTAIELSGEVLFFSLSSTKWRRGPGRGGARLSAGTSRAGRERPFLLLLMQKSVFGSWRRIEKRGPSSPRPSPPLQEREGENPRFILVSSLNSMAVGPG